MCPRYVTTNLGMSVSAHVARDDSVGWTDMPEGPVVPVYDVNRRLIMHGLDTSPVRCDDASNDIWLTGQQTIYVPSRAS